MKSIIFKKTKFISCASKKLINFSSGWKWTGEKDDYPTAFSTLLSKISLLTRSPSEFELCDIQKLETCTISE